VFGHNRVRIDIVSVALILLPVTQAETEKNDKEQRLTTERSDAMTNFFNHMLRSSNEFALRTNVRSSTPPITILSPDKPIENK
jgi:hypothetical protein